MTKGFGPAKLFCSARKSPKRFLTIWVLRGRAPADFLVCLFVRPGLEKYRALLGDVDGGPDRERRGWRELITHELELVKRGKGARRMPRRGQAMKDVASCEKPGGAARRQ